MSEWIKLHRSLTEWEWWDDHNATRLLVYLLCKVNHEQKKWKGIIIEPGTIITSFWKLSEATGMSVKSVRTAMVKLEVCGEVARTKARDGQAVTLLKWDKLQIKDKKRARKAADEGQRNGTEGATTKEVKELKNVKNQDKIPFSDLWSLYDKKIERSKCEKLWNTLSLEKQQKAIDHIPLYKSAQPDKKYRKNPLTYLRNESWEDEIIKSNDNGKGSNSGAPIGTHITEKKTAKDFGY